MNNIILHVDNVTISSQDVDDIIAEACDLFEIDDLKKEGQRPWKAVLQFVGSRLFPDTSILRTKELKYLNNNNIITNSNAYDYNIINKLCDYYIILSNRYNKLISIVAFSYFINIPTNTIDVWKDRKDSNNSDVLSTSAFKIWEKLSKNREDCLKDKLFDSSNPVGAISIGNTESGWNMPGVRESTSHRQSLTAAELPKLGENDTQLLMVEQ